MALSVDRIIPINVILRPGGLRYASFVTVRAIGDANMLAEGVTFDADTYRMYSSMQDVAADFAVDSHVYRTATYWFGQTPRPGTDSFQVWMSDELDTDIIETLNKAEDAARWMFFISIDPAEYQAASATALAIGQWASSNAHIVPLVFNDATALDSNVTDDIPSLLRDAGSRYITQKWRGANLIATDAAQNYAMWGEMAYFQRFNFDGVATSVDPEFKPIQNVIGDDLRNSQYTPLNDKLLGYYTPIELKGERVTSRTMNSWSTSAFNETVDDVFSIEVLANRFQVDGFNYLSRQKRGLRRTRDYAGLIAQIESVATQAYTNGTLAGDVEMVHPETGEDVILKNGFLMLSRPEDVVGLTEAQIAAREYPPIQIIVVLARSARVAAINVTVE